MTPARTEACTNRPHVATRSPVDEPVLLIKCAWGGKSLAVDFRPSGGKVSYSLGDRMDANLAKDPAIVGKYYREKYALTKASLANPKERLPGPKGRGYVIAGFEWHQGRNDRINYLVACALSRK